MKGYVVLSLDNVEDLKSRIKHIFDTYKPKYKTERKRKFFSKSGFVEVKYELDSPYWRGYETHILTKLNDLINMLERGDDVWLSLTSYNELVKLSKGETKVNIVLIINY